MFFNAAISGSFAICLHHDKETIQKVKVRFRLCHGKHYQRLIDICHSRTHQLILSRKDLHYIPFHILLVGDFHLHIVAHEGVQAVFAEDALCLTLINTGFYYMNVVESGNSFYYLTLHNLLVFLPSG